MMRVEEVACRDRAMATMTPRWTPMERLGGRIESAVTFEQILGFSLVWRNMLGCEEITKYAYDGWVLDYEVEIHSVKGGKWADRPKESRFRMSSIPRPVIYSSLYVFRPLLSVSHVPRYVWWMS